MLKEEFRRAFFSWAFVLALVITSVCFAIGLKEYGGQLHPCGLKIEIFSLLIGMRLMHSFMQQA